MQIRYGFHIELTLDQPTTLVTLMDIHPSRRGDVIRETPLQSSQPVPIETFIDGYGNVSRRLTAGAGGLALTLEGIVRDSGRHDDFEESADALPPSELPADVLPFLMGSRYCENDLLSNFAWEQFGHIVGGWARVQAICDFVHDRLRFSYPEARETRTAAQAMEERTGVCRDFTHLAITLCRCMNIPRVSATVTSATSACRPILRRWTSTPGSKLILAVAGTRSTPAITNHGSAEYSSRGGGTRPMSR